MWKDLNPGKKTNIPNTKNITFACPEVRELMRLSEKLKSYISGSSPLPHDFIIPEWVALSARWVS